MVGDTLEHVLAGYVHDLSYDSLPDRVRDASVISVVDAIGCAFTGYRMPSSKIALETWKQTRGVGNASVWAVAEKGNGESAAWTNCLMVHSLLHDDTLESTVGHMGSMIIPTAYAVAEEMALSGKEFLTAIVAAYEVAGKLSINTGEAIVSNGFRGSPVFGTFAAATAMGKLLKLSKEQLRSAIALAGNFSCGLLQASSKGTMEWRFQNGAALRNGMLVARLAGNGLQAAEESLEGKYGFFAVLAGPAVREEVLGNRANIEASLGQDFEINKNLYKPYATCGYNQAGVEVALALAKNHAIDHREVERIDVAVSPENERYPGGSNKGPFMTIDQALLSKPFSIANALLFNSVTAARYLSDMNQPEILELAGKVFTTPKEGMEYLDVEIELTMKNGETIRGDKNLVDLMNHTLDKERAARKFCYLTADRIDEKAALAVVEAIYNIAQQQDIAGISNAINGALGRS